MLLSLFGQPLSLVVLGLVLGCANSQTYLEDAFGISDVNFTGCDFVPPPVIVDRQTPASARWVKSQTRFWYGDLFPLVVKEDWTTIHRLFNLSTFGKLVKWNMLTMNDTSMSAVKLKYGDFASYRHAYTAYMLCDFLLHSPHPLFFNISHRFPVLMVDEVGPDEVAIATRRSINPGHEYALLMPWPHHVYYARKGLEDAGYFFLKRSRLVFRGALSGPLHHVPNAHNGMTKTSRLDILLNWREIAWADLGITFVPEHHAHAIAMENLNITVVDAMSISEQLQFKYILCIEGADISTSFGWALASHSVPFHPYPFLNHAWYFHGLVPWKHFVPILPDGSDLQTAFEWCEGHLRQCAQIARAGRRHMRLMLRPDLLSAVKREVVKMWNMRALH